MIRRKVQVPAVAAPTRSLNPANLAQRTGTTGGGSARGELATLQIELGHHALTLPAGDKGGAYSGAEVFVRKADHNRLGPQAERALSAIKGCWLRPRAWTSPSEWLFPSWSYRLDLSVAKPGGANVDGDSATLGLALGALMALTNAPTDAAIATGDLDTKAIHDLDVPVKPIGSLNSKLQTVETWATRERLTKPIRFFVPHQDPTTDEVSPGDYEQDFEAWRRRLEPLKVKLVRVATLREAARAVGAETMHPRLTDALLCLVLATGLAVGGVQWQRMKDREAHEALLRLPIHASLTAIRDDQGNAVATPYRTVVTDKAYYPYDFCGQHNAVGAGDRVHFHLKVQGDLGGFYPSIVTVGQCAAPDQPAVSVMTDFSTWTGLAAVPIADGGEWLGEVTTWDEAKYRRMGCTDLSSGHYELERVFVVFSREPVTDLAKRLEQDEFVRPLIPAELPSKVANFLTAHYPGRVFGDPRLMFAVVPKAACP